MAEVKWIKIVTDIFDDEKIALIETLPDGDSIIVLWFKLLCLAGKQNNCGVFMLNEKIAYTDEMLSTIFRRPLNTVRLALQVFEQYGMVEIINGVYTIPNWDKHQSLDALEKKREYDRLYQQEKRQKQKLIASTENTMSHDCQTTVVLQNKNKKENKKEIENNIASKDASMDESIASIVSAWNNLCNSYPAIPSVKSIGNQRKQLLNARIREYGPSAIEDAIENIRKSDFLQGKGRKGWTINFDWFIKPANFIKVYEGNYDNKTGSESIDNLRAVMEMLDE